jgi:REP element-mobilizing transposase RayT
MRRKIKPTVDNYYHIYNRGVNYQNIFFNQENWLFFLRLLRRYCTPDKAAIIASCLMPNHYHMLVYLKTEVFGEEVMQPFMVSYTKAVNKQQGRVGPIFQGPYQAKWVNNERYLLHLTRYIHLNPVTAGGRKIGPIPAIRIMSVCAPERCPSQNRSWRSWTTTLETRFLTKTGFPKGTPATFAAKATLAPGWLLLCCLIEKRKKPGFFKKPGFWR